MISIAKVNPTKLLVEQVKWKCKVYSSMFSTVIIVNIIFGLLFFNGTGSMGMTSSFVEYRETSYTMDVHFIYSIIVLFIVGWMFANKRMLNQNFSIVNTIINDTYSSFAFLALLSLFSVVSALSTMYILTFVKAIFLSGDLPLVYYGIDAGNVLLFFAVLLLASSLGYFARTTFDYSKVLFIMIIVFFIVVANIIELDFFYFFFGVSTGVIVIRSLIYSILCWCLTWLIKRRCEVIR